MQPDSGKDKVSQTSNPAPAQHRLTADPGAAISLIAYSIYEARGCIDGHALEDWLEAEARVGQGDAAAKAEAAPATAA
jgi:hypothetical protein